MIRAFFSWIRSLWHRPTKAEIQLQDFLPVRKVEKTVREGFMQKQFRLRRERKEATRKYFAALANRKPLPTVKQQCICGCGTELTVERGTLHFFANREHRASYRRRFGAIDYGKHRRA